jgi:signal peptidase II
VLRVPFLAATGSAIVIDQAVKLAVIAADPRIGQPQSDAFVSTAVIPGWLYFEAGANSGIALGASPGFGLLGGLILLAALAVLIANLALAGDVLPTRLNVALGLVIGGSLGNLIDRVRLGYVVDFIYVDVPGLDWIVFNPADIALVAGLVMFAITGPEPWQRYWRALKASRHIRGRRGQAARPGDPFGRD